MNCLSRRFLLALAASTVASPATAQQADPVQALILAMERGDAAAIRAQFAPDAGQAYGTGQWSTPDAFRRWLESDIIRGRGRVLDPVIRMEGEAVVVTGRYSNASGYRAPANFLFEIADGRIRRWRIRY